jgi:hypothetical protein
LAAAGAMNGPVFCFASAPVIESAMTLPIDSLLRSSMGTGDGRVAVVGAFGRGVERGDGEGPSRARPTEAARGREDALAPALGPMVGRRGWGVPRGRGVPPPGEMRAISFLWVSICASTIAAACWSAAIRTSLGVGCFCCCGPTLGPLWSRASES